MSISGDDLRLIRDRGPGWEAAWRRLWAELYRRLFEWVKAGPVNDHGSCRLNHTHFAVLGSVDEADDFISEYLLGLEKRAKSGKLLVAYDFEAGSDVCAYLIRRAPERAMTFIKRRWRATQRGREAAVGSLDFRRTPESESPLLVSTPEACFSEIEHSPGAELGMLVRHAAMQVHPRLDRTAKNFATLEGDLRRSMHPAGHSTGLVHLEDRHSGARGRLEAEIAARRKRLDSMHAERSRCEWYTIAEAEKRLDEIIVDLLISPLDNEDVMALLEVSAAGARQQRSRYRKRESLYQLFPRLRQLVDSQSSGRLDWLFQERRSKASRGQVEDSE